LRRDIDHERSRAATDVKLTAEAATDPELLQVLASQGEVVRTDDRAVSAFGSILELVGSFSFCQEAEAVRERMDEVGAKTRDGSVVARVVIADGERSACFRLPIYLCTGIGETDIRCDRSLIDGERVQPIETDLGAPGFCIGVTVGVVQGRAVEVSALAVDAAFTPVTTKGNEDIAAEIS
jgi:hypothetical protein